MLEIDVDVGRLAAFARDEALEQQLVLDRSMLVMPSTKQTQLFAAEPRPWQRMPRRRLSATMLFTVRK